MPRPPLAPGTHGKITFTELEDGWRARASYRGLDGARREVSRWASSKAAAERKLKSAVLEQTGGVASKKLSPDSKLSVLAEQWLEEIRDSELATNTQQTYDFAVGTYVLPGLGQWRLRELTVPVVDQALRDVRKRVGNGAAKTMRSVLSGMLGSAVRQGVMPSNPVRDTSAIPRKAQKQIRALTVEETTRFLDLLRADERAVELDLPDLCEWMLATLMRIGEACAVRDEVLTDATVEVNATVVRRKGAGLFIQPFPKSRAGHRVLPLTPAAKTLIERRATELRVQAPERVLFPSKRGHLRDVSNTTGDLREVVRSLERPEGQPAGPWSWVTSHVFRKTGATRLDEAGLSGREVADILGHEQPSMTQNIYLGRRVVSARMADVLDLSELPRSGAA